MQFQSPWRASTDERLVVELGREVCAGHVLFGIAVSVIARRDDQDDVLFALNDGSGRVASVHLSWQREQRPDHPSCVVYASLGAWAAASAADY